MVAQRKSAAAGFRRDRLALADDGDEPADLAVQSAGSWVVGGVRTEGNRGQATAFAEIKLRPGRTPRQVEAGRPHDAVAGPHTRQPYLLSSKDQ